jgi:hypothetical protein
MAVDLINYSHLKKKCPIDDGYPMVTAAVKSGVLALPPYHLSTLSNPPAEFAVSVGPRVGRDAMDCALVVECGSTAPKITWGTNFHPRTDAETDFACVAGKRNVYWITEYAPNEFCVAGWQETTGGNAQ